MNEANDFDLLVPIFVLMLCCSYLLEDYIDKKG